MRRGIRLGVLIILAVLVAVGLVGLVLATMNASNSSTSAPREAQPAVPPLHAPTDLYATGTGDGAVLLSWQPPRPAPVGYRIYRAMGRYGPYTIVGEVNDPQMDTFTDGSDLVPGTTYAYTVTAFDRQGQSAPVGPIVALVLSAPAPTPTLAAVPTPLPTFAAPTSPTLTAVARPSRHVRITGRSRHVRTSKPRSRALGGAGAATGAHASAGTAGLPTPAPTVRPSGTVGTRPATRQR